MLAIRRLLNRHVEFDLSETTDSNKENSTVRKAEGEGVEETDPLALHSICCIQRDNDVFM